jgi:protoheme IX farnesyltransferase
LFTGVAIVLGLAFLFAGVKLAMHPSDAAARRVFLISIIYLPVLFGFLVLDRYLGV